MKFFRTLEFSNDPDKNINVSTNGINKQSEVVTGCSSLQRSLKRRLDIKQSRKAPFSLNRIQAQKIYANDTLYLLVQASHRSFTFSFMWRQILSSFNLPSSFQDTKAQVCCYLFKVCHQIQQPQSPSFCLTRRELADLHGPGKSLPVR